MRMLPGFSRTAATLALALAAVLLSTHAQAETVADFDGDGKTDFSAWRSFEGHWVIRQSSMGNAQRPIVGWGAYCLGDIAVPGDYDGDGKADLAVYRSFEGNWYVLRSSDGGVTKMHLQGDVPVPEAYSPGYFAADIPICGPQ